MDIAARRTRASGQWFAVRHFPIEPLARPLRGLQQAPSTARELRHMRRAHQLNHLYRRIEPTMAAIVFAGLVLIGWYAARELVRAVVGVLA